MPLPNDQDWMRYKAATKLVQYLAVGLPAVASPIGVNAEILEGNRAGYAVSSEEDWLSRCDICSIIQSNDKPWGDLAASWSKIALALKPMHRPFPGTLRFALTKLTSLSDSCDSLREDAETRNAIRSLNSAIWLGRHLLGRTLAPPFDHRFQTCRLE